MKKVILSAVMVLALVGGSAFAATTTQNKNASGAPTMKTTKKKHKRAAKKAAKKAANKNM